MQYTYFILQRNSIYKMSFIQLALIIILKSFDRNKYSPSLKY